MGQRAAKLYFNLVIFALLPSAFAETSALDESTSTLPASASTLVENRTSSLDLNLVQKQKAKEKVVAKAALSDRSEGLSVVISSESLKKGRYAIKIEDTCFNEKKKGGHAKSNPSQGKSVQVGTFSTQSGFVSTEFVAKDLSVGDKFESVANKAISLHRLSSTGPSEPVACGVVLHKASATGG